MSCISGLEKYRIYRNETPHLADDLYEYGYLFKYDSALDLSGCGVGMFAPFSANEILKTVPEKMWTRFFSFYCLHISNGQVSYEY